MDVMNYVKLKIFIDVKVDHLLEKIIVYLLVEMVLEIHQNNVMIVTMIMVMDVHNFVLLKLDMVVLHKNYLMIHVLNVLLIVVYVKQLLHVLIVILDSMN
jgi:hypothetical protein